MFKDYKDKIAVITVQVMASVRRWPWARLSAALRF